MFTLKLIKKNLQMKYFGPYKIKPAELGMLIILSKYSFETFKLSFGQSLKYFNSDRFCYWLIKFTFSTQLSD